MADLDDKDILTFSMLYQWKRSSTETSFKIPLHNRAFGIPLRHNSDKVFHDTLTTEIYNTENETIYETVIYLQKFFVSLPSNINQENIPFATEKQNTVNDAITRHFIEKCNFLSAPLRKKRNISFDIETLKLFAKLIGLGNIAMEQKQQIEEQDQKIKEIERNATIAMIQISEEIKNISEQLSITESFNEARINAITEIDNIFNDESFWDKHMRNYLSVDAHEFQMINKFVECYGNNSILFNHRIIHI